MPIVTTNFIRGRMNKSVDERLLPPGEYVDAMNLDLVLQNHRSCAVEK